MHFETEVYGLDSRGFLQRYGPEMKVKIKIRGSEENKSILMSPKPIVIGLQRSEFEVENLCYLLFESEDELVLTESSLPANL